MGWESFDIRGADDWTAAGTRILGEMVRRRREWFGWSQRDLARFVGCHQSVISRLERGLLRGIRYRRFARIVAMLGGLDRDAPLPKWRYPDPEPNPYFVRLAAEAAARGGADRGEASATEADDAETNDATGDDPEPDDADDAEDADDDADDADDDATVRG